MKLASTALSGSATKRNNYLSRAGGMVLTHPRLRASRQCQLREAVMKRSRKSRRIVASFAAAVAAVLQGGVAGAGLTLDVRATGTIGGTAFVNTKRVDP